MNRFLTRWSAPVAALLTLLGSQALAQNSSFTYQGSLSAPGGPVGALADFKARLWTAASGGTMVGTEQSFPGVEVTRGVFSLSIPSPAGAFTDGQPLWLELDVRVPSGTGAYTTMSPRSAVSAVPLAVGLAGVAMGTDVERPDVGATAFGNIGFQLGGQGSFFYQVITPSQSGVLTRVQFYAADAFSNPAAIVRLRLGVGRTGPILQTKNITPTVGVFEIAFDDIRVTGGQRYTVDFEMTSGVVNARNADKPVPNCPGYWNSSTRAIWFATFIQPLRLSVNAAGAPWSGISGSPFSVQSDGTIAARSDRMTVNATPNGTVEPSLRVLGRGGVGSSASLELSTYDPGANAPSARIRANDLNYSSSIDFQTKNAGDMANPLTTRMRLTDDGRLGIGTTSPEALLTVTPTTGGGILVGNTQTAGRTSLYLGINGASNDYSIIQSTSASGSRYGFLTINPDGGYVGIGTRTPDGSFTLDVNGALRCVGFTNASSARYKKNIRSIEDDALASILALRPVRFDWNDEIPSMAGRADVGLIAEEVAEAIPEAVSRSNGKIEGIDYNRLTAQMIRALRQEHERSAASVRRLGDEAAELRAENAELRKRLDAIEQMLKR
ncbi:MAG: tail fiber domain-containing protein [Phycisphaerales bacterium]|nr:tail fiber domain-containing protein [Phycisphaerales bacterium]